MSEERDTYPQPRHGWTCFFCGETFHQWKHAKDHFGEEPDDFPAPACVIVANWQRFLVKTLTDLDAVGRDLLRNMAGEEMENDAQAYHAEKEALARHFGNDVSSAQDAWFKYEGLQGENEALQTRVAFLETMCNWQPEDEQRFQDSLEATGSLTRTRTEAEGER